MILDCSSLETTMRSLEVALGVSEETACARLLGFDLEATLGTDMAAEAHEVLLRQFPKRTQGWPFSNVAWFHLTRVADLLGFCRGILPVSDVIDDIWVQLQKASQEAHPYLDWKKLRHWVEIESTGHWANLYRLKQSPEMQGPFGLLLREPVALLDPGDNHYLRCPETVEDICIEISSFAGVDVIDAYRSATSPVVVKFLDSEARPDCVGAALQYAYCKLRGAEYSCTWNTCFDGKGVAVPPDQIETVERVEGPWASNGTTALDHI